MTTPRDAIAGLSERLKSPVWNEDTMKQWDSWRGMIAKMPGASLPRDCFESFLDGIDEERTEAATQLDSLLKERDALQARVKELEEERLQVRGILAGSDYGSLPNDWTLARIADARMNDVSDLRWQVKDTCARAEAAEARATHAEQERDEAYERAAGVALLAIRQYKEQQKHAHADGDEGAGYKESGSFFSTDQNLPSFVDAAIRRLAGPEKEGE